jgi:hypothetical protein
MELEIIANYPFVYRVREFSLCLFAQLLLSLFTLPQGFRRRQIWKKYLKINPGVENFCQQPPLKNQFDYFFLLIFRIVWYGII